MSAKDVRALFSSYPPPVPDIALAVRELVLATLNRPEETPDRGMVSYGYGPGYKGMVCVIILSQKGVKLGLAHGFALSDPQRLLAGAGKVHRHIAFASVSDVKRAGVKPLLKATYAAWEARSKSQSVR